MKRGKKCKTDRLATSQSSSAFCQIPHLWHLLAVIAILALGILAYANSFTVPFILDDISSIVANPDINSLSFRLEPRILGKLSFAFSYRIGGLEPAGYHAVNLMLHLANAVLVYLLVLSLFRTPGMVCWSVDDTGKPGLPRVIALVAAMIFVAHPIQTQAVTYLAQRVAVQAAFCYVGAVVCYLGFRLAAGRRRFGFLALSVTLAVAGVLTKENVVSLPLAVLLVELLFFRGPLLPRLLPLSLFFLPVLATVLVFVGRYGFGADMIATLGSYTAERGAPARLTYLLTQFPVIVSYLRLFLLPVGLNLDHDVRLYTSLLDLPVTASLALLVMIIAGAVQLGRRGAAVAYGPVSLLILPAFGIIWYFVALSIESGAVPIRDVMFEHRIYLPSVGLVIGLAAGAGWLLVRITPDRGKAVSRLLLVGVVAALCLGAATLLRNRVWQSEISVWKDVVRKSPAKARGYGALGHAYQRSGMLPEALTAYVMALKISPQDHIARNNLGAVYLKLKRYPEAIDQFLAALASAPQTAATHYNLGLAYRDAGRLEEAESSFGEALRLKPDYREAAANLAAVQKVKVR